jgi:hypothetical protein
VTDSRLSFPTFKSASTKRAWPVSQVISALLTVGLTLTNFTEYSEAYWDEFPNLPDAERRKFPNTYSLDMVR